MPVLDFPSNHIEPGKVSPPVGLAIIARETDENILEVAAEYAAARDFLYTIGIMCAPADESFAQSLLHSQWADGLHQVMTVVRDSGLEGYADATAALVVADRKKVEAQIKKPEHMASAYALRWIVSKWRDDSAKRDASLSRAASVIEEWGKEHRVPGMGEQHFKRNIWPKYSCVSHLWAALSLADDAKVNPSTPSGFVIFCSTAQWLLEQGAAIVPKGRRAGETVLSLERAWRVPEAFVHRAPNGSLWKIWSTNPVAHDIRMMSGPR